MNKFEDNPLITILLATYNGEKYLEQQLDSILNQTYTNWLLYIRDDHSSDTTPHIIADYQSRYNTKIFFIKDNLGNLGSSQNFNALLQLVRDRKYIMFCDQDDFWLPNKIAITLNKLIDLEKHHGSDCPLLVHTSFKYADVNLREITSKIGFQATKIVNLNLSHIIAQNPIYGCTVMINNALLSLVKDIPLVAENHDYWVAIVASALGKIAYLNEKTILYRQHGNNVSGNYNDDSLIQRFKRIVIYKKNFQDARSKINMAKELKNLYGDYLNATQLKIIDNFVAFSETKSISLFMQNLKNGIRRQTIGQTFMFYSSVFLLKK